MKDEMYNKQLIMRILERLKVDEVDLHDAHQFNHLTLSRRKELLKKYNMEK